MLSLAYRNSKLRYIDVSAPEDIPGLLSVAFRFPTSTTADELGTTFMITGYSL